MLSAPEAVAVSAFMQALRGSNLPIRRPSFNQQSFWSRPIFLTKPRPVSANTPWEDFLSISGVPHYIAVITHFVATTVGDSNINGLQYRFLLNGALLSGTQFAAGQELNKVGPNTYPVKYRPIYQPVTEIQTLTLQVQNLTGLQRTAVAALVGWHYETMDGTIIGTETGLTDSIYPPMTGAPY